ncbi:hypothetical protein Bca101_070082 [Brassica carinata]
MDLSCTSTLSAFETTSSSPSKNLLRRLLRSSASQVSVLTFIGGKKRTHRRLCLATALTVNRHRLCSPSIYYVVSSPSLVVGKIVCER